MATMIVVAGEALIDLVIRPDDRIEATPGGGPFNTARTIARLGGRVAFLGCLATDRFGQRLRDTLVEDGVDLALAATTDLPTTLAIAELDPDGAATYRFHTAETSAPSLTDAAVAAALEARPDALHLGTLGLVLEPMASALSEATERIGLEAIVMLDANCRPSVIRDRAGYLARLRRVAARADVIKVSADDLAYLDPDVEPIVAAHSLAGHGRGVILLTDGGRPVAVSGASGEFEVAVPEVAVVDTIGAGDAFGGAFLARWMEAGHGRRGLTDPAAVREAVELAIEVANLTCQRVGADPPRRVELGWPAV
jgi:fructokinase